MCVHIRVIQKGSKSSVQQRKARKKQMNEETNFLPCANSWQKQDKEVQVSVHAYS